MPKTATSDAGRAPEKLHRLVDSDAGTSQWRRIERIHPGWNLGDDVLRRSRGVLCVPAVDGVPGVALLFAQRLPAGGAVPTGTAGESEPWHGDPVAHLDLGHTGPEALDNRSSQFGGSVPAACLLPGRSR
jgi:hypothetical protein